jgi:hypothetical protein
METIDAATAQGAIREYTDTEAALAELRQRFGGVIFDVTTREGEQDARAARKELVSLRTGLEAKRKMLKAPALEYSRRIDSEAARITAEIEKLEKPIDAQVRAQEEAREAERQRKAAEEAARMQAIQDAIAALRRIPPEATTASPAKIEEHITLVANFTIDAAAFHEFVEQAEAARKETLGLLRELHRAAVAREAEAARLAAEREELARLRAEAAERDRAARAQQEAEQAAERERMAREQQRLNDEHHARRLEVEARERAQREEAERLAAQERAQRAEQERLEAEAKRQREEAWRIEKARIAAEMEAEERKADVARQRLHDAAPALLEALRKLLFNVEHGNGASAWEDSKREARIAIALATGSNEEIAA